MKTSKKALALALAAAMAFTGIPVTDAEAASTAKLSATKATIYVGGSKTVSVKAPSTWKSVAISTVSSNKKSVATVKKASSKSFKVTAVKAGTATITTTLTYKGTTKEVTTDVTVKAFTLKDVKQTKLNTLEASVSGKTADLKPEAFTITNKTTGQKLLVKEVSVDKVDATKVTLTTYVDLTNGNEIDVTLDGVTKTIKATDGQIASVSVDPVTIPAATETKIEAVTKDASGVELKRFAYGSAYPANFTFNITTTKGYTAGEKLYLPEKGDTATAKVEYSTGKYDANGKSEVITSGDVTITAGDVAATTSKISLRYGKDQGKAFDDLKDNAVIAKNDTMYAAVKIVNDKNEEVSNYADYTVESNNRNILLASADALDGSKATITLNAVDEGTTALLVKDKSGKTVETFPITVKAERKAAKLTVDHPDFSVVTGSGLSKETVGLTQKTVVFSLKDQYGEDMTISDKTLNAPECTAAGQITAGVPAATKDEANKYAEKSGNNVTFKGYNSGNGVAVGAYTYKVSLAGQHNENINASFTVKVQDPAKLTGTETKRLVAIDENGFETSNIDTVINKYNVATRKDGLNVSILFLTYKSGVAISSEEIEDGAISGKDPDGKNLAVVQTQSSTTTASSIVTGGGVRFAAVATGSGVVTKAAIGNYKIQVTDSYSKKYETTFTVRDTQPKVTVKRVKESSDLRANAGDYGAVVNDAFEFYYEGTKYTAEANPDVTVNTNNIYVKSVKVKVTITDGTNAVDITIPVDVKQYIALK